MGGSVEEARESDSSATNSNQEYNLYTDFSLIVKSVEEKRGSYLPQNRHHSLNNIFLNFVVHLLLLRSCVTDTLPWVPVLKI